MQIGYLITDLNQLPDVAVWGYDYAEALPGLLDPDYLHPERSTAAAEAARKRICSSPVPVAALCGFLPDPEMNELMVVGPHVNSKRLRAYVTRLFDTMAQVGIDVIGYGSGSSRWVPTGFDRDRALDQVCEFLQLCDEIGRTRGVRVALEPYNRDDANLLNTVAEALALVQRIDRPYCRLMADFFHMGLNGEAWEELIAASPYLIHAHIAEPGRGRPQSTSDDHVQFLQTLRHAGYNGRVTQTGDLPAYGSPAEAAAALKAAAEPMTRRQDDKMTRRQDDKMSLAEAPGFRFSRMVDLSQPLRPGENHHPWFRYETQVESIVSDPETVPPMGRWYVVTQIAMSGHAGTHVEAPLHAMAGGASVGDLPVERFFGEAIILDLRDVPWSQPVERPRLMAAAHQAGGIRADDIAFLHFDWAERSATGGYPPYPTSEALAWLVEQGIKLLGIDTPGLELPDNKGLVNHRLLFQRGIPLIESLVNLAELRTSRVFVFAQPLPVHGADAIPLRVLAFESGDIQTFG